MSPLMWTLVISIVLMLGMITYKRIENSRGGVIFAPVLRKRTDDLVENSIQYFSAKGLCISQKVKKTFSTVPHHINVWLHRVWRKVSKKIDGYFDRLRGHHNIDRK